MADRINTPVLDMTAGSRMMWFNKHNGLATFVDKRQLHEQLLSGHVIDVDPDVLADWTLGLPFENETYNLVLFDPPHLIHAGDNSWLAKKYATLNADNWQEIIKLGFDEGMRVLKQNGTLIFKWNDSQIPLREILDVVGVEPLFGQKRQKTHWLVFMKE